MPQSDIDKDELLAMLDEMRQRIVADGVKPRVRKPSTIKKDALRAVVCKVPNRNPKI